MLTEKEIEKQIQDLEKRILNPKLSDQATLDLVREIRILREIINH